MYRTPLRKFKLHNQNALRRDNTKHKHHLTKQNGRVDLIAETKIFKERTERMREIYKML